MAKNNTKNRSSSKSSRVIELSIQLEHTKPLVWRHILVRDSLSMYELHEIIQVTMGWMHSHLFMFKAKEFVIAEPNPDDDWYDHEFKDARKTKLSNIFKKVNDAIVYEYDFGDSWEHKIKFESVAEEDELRFDVPRCIGGENACPPEDCGGVPGFEHVKQVIQDPHHEEYEEMMDWLDQYYPNYDPQEFSLGAVNQLLKIGASKYLRLMPMFYR